MILHVILCVIKFVSHNLSHRTVLTHEFINVWVWASIFSPTETKKDTSSTTSQNYFLLLLVSKVFVVFAEKRGNRNCRFRGPCNLNVRLLFVPSYAYLGCSRLESEYAFLPRRCHTPLSNTTKSRPDKSNPPIKPSCKTFYKISHNIILYLYIL